jgi:hypothetical protein
MISMPCFDAITAVRSMSDLSNGMSAPAAASRHAFRAEACAPIPLLATTSRSGGRFALSSVRILSGTSAGEETGRREVRSSALSYAWMSSRELAEHPG